MFGNHARIWGGLGARAPGVTKGRQKKEEKRKEKRRKKGKKKKKGK